MLKWKNAIRVVKSISRKSIPLAAGLSIPVGAVIAVASVVVTVVIIVKVVKTYQQETPPVQPIPLPVRKRQNSDSHLSNDDNEDNQENNNDGINGTGNGRSDTVVTGVSGNRNLSMGNGQMRNRQGTNNVSEHDSTDVREAPVSATAPVLACTSSNPCQKNSPTTIHKILGSPSTQFRELQPSHNELPRGPLISEDRAEPTPMCSAEPESEPSTPSTSLSSTPSLSQSYIQDTDHEIGLEPTSPLSSSESSGTSSPSMAVSRLMTPGEFVSFSQLFASESHNQEQQPKQQQQQREEVTSPVQSWSVITSPDTTSPLPAPSSPVTEPNSISEYEYSSRSLSPSSITSPMSSYQSFPTSPWMSVFGSEMSDYQSFPTSPVFSITEMDSDTSSPMTINVTDTSRHSPSPTPPTTHTGISSRDS